MIERTEVYFNKVFILQSLKNERRTGDEIEIKIKNISYRDNRTTGKLIDIESKQHFFKILGDIKNESLTGTLPFIHFEIHGSVEGLELDTGEQIQWDQLKEPLREINKIAKNNLFVSLATCFGAHLLKLYKPWETCPFYGYIGPLKEVRSIEVEASYSTFFEVLLLENDFAKAIKALQDTVPTNSNNYVFLNCYAYFDRLMTMYKEENLNPRIRSARIKDVVRKFKEGHPNTGLSNNEIKKHAERLFLTNKEDEEFERMRTVFLHESL